MRQTVIVSEAGMYEVVIRSDKPEAVSCPGTDENTALSYLDRGGVFVNLGTLLCGCCAERVNIALTWWSRLDRTSDLPGVNGTLFH